MPSSTLPMLAVVLLFIAFPLNSFAQNNCDSIFWLVDSETSISAQAFPVGIKQTKPGVDAIVKIEGQIPEIFTIPQDPGLYDIQNFTIIWASTQKLEGTFQVSVEYDGCQLDKEITIAPVLFPDEEPFAVHMVYRIETTQDDLIITETFNVTIFETSVVAYKYSKELHEISTDKKCAVRYSKFTNLNVSWHDFLHDSADYRQVVQDQPFTAPAGTAPEGFAATDGNPSSLYGEIKVVFNDDTKKGEESPYTYESHHTFYYNRDPENLSYSAVLPTIISFLTAAGVQGCDKFTNNQEIRDSCDFRVAFDDVIVEAVSCTPGELHVYAIALIVLAAAFVFFLILGIVFLFACRKAHPEYFHPSFGTAAEYKKSSQEATAEAEGGRLLSDDVELANVKPGHSDDSA